MPRGFAYRPATSNRRCNDGGRSIVRWTGLVASLAILGGCASTSSPGAEAAGLGSEASLQLTIRNEAANPISVFVWWQSGRRVRLGDVAGVSSGTFTTPFQTGGIWFEIQDRLEMTSRRGRRPDQFLPVNRGEHLEVVAGQGGFIRSVRSIPRT